MFESELFGYEKGAFTDAVSDRKGRFELADKGTIFLDEIGELDLSCQVKLLRVLQEQTFEPLGESRPRKVDVRVVCATNANLEEMVREHTFREDLFYRINLITVHLPALRERREDIPLLVRHFTECCCQNNKLPETRVSDDALEYLSRLPYPGNIRELKNLVERTVLVCGKDLLTAADFKSQYHPSQTETATISNTQGLTLEELEKQTIIQTLEKFVLAFMLLLLWGILLIATLKQENNVAFQAGQALVFLSLILLVYFYRKVVNPLKSIANGMDLLREQDFSSRLSPVGQAEADRIVKMFNRMMDQLKNERLRLREQNHFLDLLISVSPMGVIILTFDNEVSMLNDAAVHFLGFSNKHEITGKPLKALTTPLAEEINRLDKDSTQTIRLSDSQIYRCSRLSFIDRGFAHPFILIESLTTEVVKAEKKAYEKVIRMIAHEVNNTTAGITSTLDSVTEALEDVDGSEDLREVMKVCSDRCYGMSQFITNFANVVKIPEPHPEAVRLNDRVVACQRFMETICREREITLQNELCPENPEVMIDTVLFEQVLVNILKNAAESIGSKGNITIRTTNSPVMLEIADNGPGISRETETKLFSPFFSTKPNGQGIGLLFIREVLSNHGCIFSLRTYSDGLTRFRISFPEKK